MKRIRLNDNWILREVYRYTDRVKNEVGFSLAIEPAFGVAYSADIAAVEARDSFNVSEKVNARLWEMCKDATQQQFVDLLYNFLTYYYPTVVEYYAWVEADEYEEVPATIPGGSPELYRVPFTGQAVIDELKAEKILGTSDFMLLHQLYERGITQITLETY